MNKLQAFFFGVVGLVVGSMAFHELVQPFQFSVVTKTFPEACNTCHTFGVP